MVRAMDSQIKGCLPAIPLSGNNLRQVVSDTCASVTKQCKLVAVRRWFLPYGWEGNRRSGITLAVRHRLVWFICLQA